MRMQKMAQNTVAYFTKCKTAKADEKITIVLNELKCHAPVNRVFTAQRYAMRGICRRRVSVCVSVTLRYCTKTAKRRIMQITLHDSPMTLVF